MPLARQAQHKKVVVNFYVFDGLMVRPLNRHVRARHALYYSEHGVMKIPEHKLLELTGWVFGMRCASHVCSSGIKTGLQELASEFARGGA